ncbi:MAG: Hsp20/alpha crystallin family protein [Candidatus Lokiarchaeota archaeon]|nr:Hsp20/alpha crystallin family protein [Candidatus Lokiarchaeota archaeon]
MSEDNKIEVSKKDKKDREMTVRRESPSSLFQQMDRLFDDLRSSFLDDFYFPFRRTRPLSLIIRDDEPIFRTPLANITQDDKFFNITAELPGLDKGDIEITIQDGNLEIKGELKEEKKEEKEGELIRREYHSSKYFRSFALPEYIDENKIEANLEKGILHLKIPKVEPPKPEKKKIDIK